MPNEFKDVLNEPAFYPDEATFFIWRKKTDKKWHTGISSSFEEDDFDGSEKLLYILDGNPTTYVL